MLVPRPEGHAIRNQKASARQEYCIAEKKVTKDKRAYEKKTASH